MKGDWYQRYIHFFILAKCFFLVDRTRLELIHHALQYFLIQIFKADSHMLCNTHIMRNYEVCYAMMITPMFQQIKEYVKPRNELHNQVLDYLTFFSFFYFRGRFIYSYMARDASVAVNDYIIMNYDTLYSFYIMVGVHIALIVICVMNIYWGYRISRSFYFNVFVDIGR